MVPKKWIFTTVLLASAISIGIGWACTSNSLLVNGFSGSSSTCGNSNDILNWQNPQLLTKTATTCGGANFVCPSPDSDYYGMISWPANTSPYSVGLTIFDDSSGANWSGHQTLMIAFATNDFNAYNAQQELDLASAGKSIQFQGVTVNTQSDGSSASKWTYIVISLNYAENLGLNLNALSYVSLTSQAKLAPLNPYMVAYADLNLDDTNVTANSPVTSGLTYTAGCGQVILQWPAQTQTGSSPIAGYHIYRSAGSSGPWASLAYVGTTSYTDNVPPGGAYYQVLPYSNSLSSYPNAALLHAAADPANPAGGVLEAALAPTGTGPFVPNAPSIPMPTGLAGSGCSSPASIYLEWNAMTVPSGCSAGSVNGYYLQRADNSIFSLNPVGVTVSSGTQYQDTSVIGGSSYWYEVAAIDKDNNIGPYSSSINVSASGSSCGYPTVTATQTPGGSGGGSTATPTVTPTPTAVVTVAVNSSQPAYIYPNPFHPDLGQKFHVGNVDASATITIYNMVGAMVLQKPESYFTANGGWDGSNNNGVKVVTGVYFLVVSGSNTVYNVAVIRGQ